MSGRIVGFSLDPGAPKDTDPGARRNADGGRGVTAAAAGGLADRAGPGRNEARGVGERGDGASQALVAGPSEDDAAALAGGMRHRAGAGFGSEPSLGLEAAADVAELGEDLRRADAAGTRDGHHDLAAGESGDRVLDPLGELGELGDEGCEPRGEGAHQLAAAARFGVAGEAAGPAARPFEQRLGRAPAASSLSEKSEFARRIGANLIQWRA